ncbi:MAG: ABC transporter ATP-binding protein [Ignavibacteria bacterium]|nr:ABC transporter ATP-binding protein [Ignavibacteria bacterium]
MAALSIHTKDLTKKYSGKTIFKNISFELSSGDSAVIVGRNGSGKSTLMKIIAGIISPSSGTMSFMNNGNKVEFHDVKRKLGFVSPYLNLYDELSAIENLRLFSGLKSDSAAGDEGLVSLLELTGLADRRNDEVKTYSSGMKQKLKIAFAMLNEPELLMLDEPRSNLDKSGIETMERIAEMQKGKGILIIATNDEDDLKLCSKRINIEEHK